MLSLVISDLPTGTAAAVTVVDPSGNHTLVTASQTITALPGLYQVTAVAVVVGTSTYHAMLPVQTVTIPPGSTTGIVVDYKNVVPSKTKVLDAATAESLSISADGLTLTMFASSVAASLNVGDVVIAPPTSATGPAPKGLIRRVISSVNTGQQVTLITIASSLAEAFQRLTIDLQEHLTTDAIVSIKPARGVTFRSTGTPKGSVVHPAVSSLQNPCKGFSLGIFDIPEPINASLGSVVNVSGSVELCSGINLSADLIGTGFLGLVPQLNSFKATTTFGDFGDLTVTAAVAGSASTGRLPLATMTFKPIQIPDLPLWITPEAVLFVGGNVNALSSVSSEASTSAIFSKGISWGSSGGWTATPLVATSQFDFQPPSFFNNLDAKEYAGVELSLYAWDLLGMVFAPQGFYELQADTTKLPLWTLNTGFEGPVSLRAKVVGIDTVPDYDLGDAFSYSKVLAAGPVLQMLAPQLAASGSADLNITVTGANFTDAAVIKFGSTSLVTTKQSSSQLTTVIPAGSLFTPGTVQVTVDNLGSGGNPLTDPAHFAETSNALSFTISNSAVTITPTSVALTPGETQIFAASVAGGGQIDWSVREGLTCGTISNMGVYTAPSTERTCHVVALNHSNPANSAVATINVVAIRLRTGVLVPSSSPIDGSFSRYTVAWSAPFPDTNYAAVCNVLAINLTQGSFPLWISSKALGSVDVEVALRSEFFGAELATGTIAELDCIGIEGDSPSQDITYGVGTVSMEGNSGMGTIPLAKPLRSGDYAIACTPEAPTAVFNPTRYELFIQASTASKAAASVGVELAGASGTDGTVFPVDCVGAGGGSSLLSSVVTPTSNATWSNPFPDTNYSVVCSGNTPPRPLELGSVVSNLITKSQTGVTVAPSDGSGNPINDYECLGAPYLPLLPSPPTTP